MSKKKILIIDDEVSLTILMKGLIQNHGDHTIFLCHNGYDGLQICMEEIPDVVFLDYAMPKMKGDEVLTTLRQKQQTKDVPIVIMSGLCDDVYVKNVKGAADRTPSIEGKGAFDDETENKLKKLNVAGRLPKPFTKEQLFKILDGIIGSP